jgi:translocation and assembly module TamA
VNLASLLLALLLLITLGAYAAPKTSLEYSITGLNEEQLANANAYLGAAPRGEEERDNFLFSARALLDESLNALGYYESEVDFELDRQNTPWQLIIDVDPGERVLLSQVDVEIFGDAKDDRAFSDLLANMPLRVGDGLHHERYEDFKNSLQTLGRERGYFDARLTRHRVTVDLEAEEAMVELHYQSGRRYTFGEVLWDEFPLRSDILQRLQSFETGEPFSAEQLRQFQADLQQSGYFGSALVRALVPDPETSSVPVRVEMRRGDRNLYRVGLGYSTDTQSRVSLTWQTPLINASGHSQETRVEYSPVTPRVRFDYTIPLGHPLRDNLLLSARAEKNEYGSLDSFQKTLSMRREWVRGNWISGLGLRYLDEDWDVGRQSLNNNYVLPGATLSHTRRTGNVLDPTTGFSQLYGAEFGAAEAGSDLNLLRIYSNLRGVISLGERHRMVGRAELGAVYFADSSRPDLAPSLSFFAGGAQSIRGYAYQSLGPVETIDGPDGEQVDLVVGGDRLAVFSAEYQYYVTPEWRATLFVDAGNAFNARDFDPVTGAGIGVHYVSPVGAIRIDFANPVSEDSGSWRVHLTVGAEF